MSLQSVTSAIRKDDEDLGVQHPSSSYAAQSNNYFYPSMNAMVGMPQWPQMVMPFQGGMPSYESYVQAMMQHHPQQYMQAMQQYQHQQSLMLPPFRQQPHYFPIMQRSSYGHDQALSSIENISRDASIESLTTGASAVHLTSSPEVFYRPSELIQQRPFISSTTDNGLNNNDRDATIDLFQCTACTSENEAVMVTCAMETCQMTFHLSCAGLDELPGE
jgi:hypothetical protein